MSESSDRHSYQAIFQLCTESNQDRVGISLLKDPILWDTDLVVNETQNYKAHIAILSVHSGYFKTLFEKENLNTRTEIHIEVNDLSSFDIAFKFLYTGRIPNSLQHKQLKLLFGIANTYKIQTLVEIIQKSLSSPNIDANKCLLVLSMENELQRSYSGMCSSAITIAAENFRYMCHQDGFLNLNYNTIQDIICHSNFRVPNKKMPSMALHRWLEANKETIPDLSKSIMTLNQYRHPINSTSLFSSIVCYFADGSTRYTNMTINAINSFLRSTPEVMVGLLVKNDDTRDKVMSAIAESYHYRIVSKYISKKAHFKDWNPTQYKLDILMFLDHGFEEIYWMDSDTIVYEDLRPYLEAFRCSSQLFYFVLDHVMYDSLFVTRWKRQHQDTFIPQACFMGFKSSCMRAFFALWKSAWKLWIEPKPFTMYQDPNPEFEGSGFCIEQYALGNAISDFIEQEGFSRQNTYGYQQLILPIERKLIWIKTNERMQSFYPSSKLQSMLKTSTSVFTSSYPGIVPCLKQVAPVAPHILIGFWIAYSISIIKIIRSVMNGIQKNLSSLICLANEDLAD
ncbi:unnamed protein product [Rotaria socialis]|uniref:BTB domain-containing protein n=1 Tax=Rotaria socialis TaxID=392032 RepID=A0A817WI73_9BILA|nr:unnamed protein product [Rotaria socialis]CAF3737510.1 unnamed protein product [Rotaria socialis]CAF4588961.1 unnamed protein product [Rotaria socialis]CAF4631989.1 unnamed protein product [Rotaria socialis]